MSNDTNANSLWHVYWAVTKNFSSKTKNFERQCSDFPSLWEPQRKPQGEAALLWQPYFARLKTTKHAVNRIWKHTNSPCKKAQSHHLIQCCRYFSWSTCTCKYFHLGGTFEIFSTPRKTLCSNIYNNTDWNTLMFALWIQAKRFTLSASPHHKSYYN